MNLLKITHNIPDKTINLEEKRDITKMNEEDLIWCFGAEVTFKNLETEDILMDLEVALFGFLEEFLSVVAEFTSMEKGESRLINDPYGAYSLEVSKGENFFKIVDNFSGQSFQSNANELKRACAELLKDCTIDVERKFPALLENLEYIKMRKRFFELI